MKTLTLGLAGIALTVSGCGAGGMQDNAMDDCAAPQLLGSTSDTRADHGPITIAAGGDLTVYGRYFADACQEYGDGGSAAADRTVNLVLASENHDDIALGVASPSGPDFAFQVTVRIPTDAPRGLVKVRGERDRPQDALRLRIVSSPR